MFQPKYFEGQLLYYADGRYCEKQIQCPDCLGRKEWKVELPNGEKFEIPCNTCQREWWEESTGFISIWGDEPIVTHVLIQSIRIDTSDKENPITYCTNDGYVCNEKQLFETRTEAMICAEEIARKLTVQRQEQESNNLKDKKKKSSRKPSFHERQIKILEKENKKLRQELVKYGYQDSQSE